MNAEKLFYPIVKAAIDIPTKGFGGAFMEILFEVPYQEQRKKKIDNFMKNTIKKINELNLKISEKEFKEIIQKPEFFQLFIKILNKIQVENRKKIQQIYSNILTNDINQKMGCYEKRKRRKGDPVAIEYFFDDDYDEKRDKIVALNPLKSSYVEGLVSEMVSRQLIRREQEVKSTPDYKVEGDIGKELKSIKSEIEEEYLGTELGHQFYRFIVEYK